MATSWEDLGEIITTERNDNQKSWYDDIEDLAKKHRVSPLVIAGMLGLVSCPTAWRQETNPDDIREAYGVIDDVVLH